jgi:very-short-patch-repair endonuclease
MVEGASGRHDMRRGLITTRARTMRKAMTEPEVVLWSRLRGRSPDRPTFRRQHPFGNIILHFYCSSAALAVEVDGATHWHDEGQAKDDARDFWLAGQGVEVLRIPASSVYHDLDNVVDGILRRAAERQQMRLAPSTNRSSPGLRRGRRTVPLPPLRGGGKDSPQRLTSPAKRREGDHRPKSRWWRGRAGGRAITPKRKPRRPLDRRGSVTSTG